ncbi:AAA family ATPase [Actinomadura opuntiae]|uniref:AAA family ATPase n=1 Tax=Actinomadura sp. OS1-43 TaxID=604315 RepID=UPI00255AA660|nr:AAA family ATPase [Actinomadura sp. OS1-43]MDL4820785.1 AAA family ATPase [Actinomadura sp. OS1-43]
MRIQRVAIKNYRCLRDVDIRFDGITTFIGPNGVGKSAVLRALDWFFNGTAQTLTEEDVWAGAEDRQISVEVEFGDLTDLDRAHLGKYAAGSAETVRLWRRWEDGTDKLSGHALAYPPFDEIRRATGAMEQRRRYKALCEARPELGLPAAGSAKAVEEALSAWEDDHRDELEATELPADTHFFGFAGQAKMTGLFDYVFVSADLRAVEEGRDAKGSIIGRIMDQAVDRTQAERDLLDLQAVFNDDRGKIHAEHFEAQLDELSDELTREVEQFTRGRRLRVSSHIPELRVPQPLFQVSVEDGTASTRVDQQGHGFQRAVLITALRVLAERKAAEASRTVFLAIEEPELFQHPVQARTFASVLRRLAAEQERGIQISYATHSPYFLETDGFHQIRRMTRTQEDGAPSVRVHSTTQQAVKDVLGMRISDADLARQIARAYLTDMPEAMFARAVVLVEGVTDKGVLEGCGFREDPLNTNGIMVVSGEGKQNLRLPYAILTTLGIPTYVVFDGDRHNAESQADDTEDKRANRVVNGTRLNRKLLSLLGGDEEDWPETTVAARYAVFRDRLEDFLKNEWQDWETTKKQLIADGHGTDGKSEHTYFQATRRTETPPPAKLKEIIARVQLMAKEN